MKTLIAAFFDTYIPFPQAIILDYFFSPAGWARERWSDGFFMNSLPLMKEVGILHPHGKVWLPWLECVDESLCEFRGKLAASYDWKLVSDPWENPLFVATNDADPTLATAPDTLINSNQLQYLLDYSDTPFCVMDPYWPKPGDSHQMRLEGLTGIMSGCSSTRQRHAKRSALAVCNAVPLTKISKNLTGELQDSHSAKGKIKKNKSSTTRAPKRARVSA